MDVTESKEREAYRMKCKDYGVEGNCHKRSLSMPYFMHLAACSVHTLIACTPDCDCARMRRYDKRKKEI